MRIRRDSMAVSSKVQWQGLVDLRKVSCWFGDRQRWFLHAWRESERDDRLSDGFKEERIIAVKLVSQCGTNNLKKTRAKHSRTNTGWMNRRRKSNAVTLSSNCIIPSNREGGVRLLHQSNREGGGWWWWFETKDVFFHVNDLEHRRRCMRNKIVIAGSCIWTHHKALNRVAYRSV